jgi:putative addiction module component (TIGR02574 family)
MTTEAKELVKKALKLPNKQRAMIASRLFKSVEQDEIEKAWGQEIAKRIREYESGKVKSIPWEQVRKEMIKRQNECKRS